VTFTEVDDDYTGSYSYYWDSNITYSYSGIGRSKVIETDELDDGFHNITVRISKNYRTDSEGYFHLYINKSLNQYDDDFLSSLPDHIPYEKDPDEQKNYIDTLSRWIILHFIIFMLFILGPLLCMVIHKLYIRSRDRKLNEKEVKG
jgi:hypothetical protein